MEELIVGIDLGTTNSCVAVGGEAPGCFRPEGIKGFAIVPDEYDRNFTPSVLYYTGNKDTPYEIGDDAKQQVDGKYPPVMFAKRHLGSDKKFQVDDNRDLDLTPREVSTEILKYLKAMAEAKLGQEIKRAVVTVPAYFDLHQKKETKEAMEMAGFIANDPKYIILEPDAAALTYTRMIEKECLNIMVYDLGGGTFDITVLKKEDDHVEVIKFGGDRAFGGWNFDRFIADHFVEELKNKGYKLDLKIEESLTDNMIYTKILLLAERAKRELSGEQVYRIRKPAYIEDQNGKSINIDIKLSRKDFEAMILEKVDYTIDLCRETLDKSGLTIEQIDKIIMVGGSSYIPLIQRRLQEEFKQEPKILEPDLAVAIGAAVHASTMGISSQGENIELDLKNYPIVTSKNEIALEGEVKTMSGASLDKGYLVEVTDSTGMPRDSMEPGENGAFYFDLKLREDCENTFYLKVRNPGEESEIEREIKITHSFDVGVEDGESGANIPPVTVQLPRTIYIKGKGGKKREFAREGSDLPQEKKETFQIIKEGHTSENALLELEIEIIEGNKSLGTLTVKDIPGARIGSGDPCDVTIKISADSKIIVGAHLPTVDIKGNAAFEATVDKIMSKEQLDEELERLEFEWKGLQVRIGKDQLAESGIPIERLFTRVKEALRGHGADFCEASRLVTEITRMLKEVRPVELSPGKEEFHEICEAVRRKIKAAEAKSEQVKVANLGRSLDAVMAEANDAYRKSDQSKLDAANNQVKDLEQQAEAYTRPSPVERHYTAEDVMKLLSAIQQLAEAIRWKLKERKAEGHPDHDMWVETLKETEKAVEAKKRGINFGDQESLKGVYIDLNNLAAGNLLPLHEKVCQEQGGVVLDT